MSGRELVILLLGLAIVAVVLRGLYVALNARRGQIKLAIDKNIPQNVDLEALELAELPGGGARVVTRSLEEVNRQNSALDKAESRARTIDLADDEDESHIPVLMDAVELSQAVEVEAAVVAQPQESPQWEEPEEIEPVESAFDTQDTADSEEAPAAPEEVGEEEFTSYIEQTPSIGDDWEEDEETEDAVAESSEQALEAADEEEDPDAVLFDYEQEDEDDDDVRRDPVDTLSSVAPDYDDNNDDSSDEDSASAEVPDDVSYGEDDSADYRDDDWSDEEEAAEQEQAAAYDEEYDEEQEYVEAAEQTEVEEDTQPFDADDDIDEFSMTAGERIGGVAAKTGEAKQTSLFDDDEADEAEKPSKRSLFSMFGRKSPKRREHRVPEEGIEEESVAAAPALVDYEVDEPIQRVQEEQAPVKEREALLEEEVVDELDQKRAASVEQEAEVPQAKSEEFEHSEVLVLNVTAKDGRVFAGDDLLHILILSGLKFGDMNIFHKRLSKDNQGSVIFSVANMLNPGTFDLNNMDEFTTLGISFFLALPTPINNLDAFEQMLGVAQEIRDALGGDLKDDHRNGMTAQTIEHYRQRVRDFELRRLKAVAARG